MGEKREAREMQEREKREAREMQERELRDRIMDIQTPAKLEAITNSYWENNFSNFLDRRCDINKDWVATCRKLRIEELEKSRKLEEDTKKHPGVSPVMQKMR